MSRPPVKFERALIDSLPRDKRLLVAVSGGIDSMALLAGCYRLRDELRLELEVAHVDHGIRAESSVDASFVARVAEQYGLRFHLKRLPGEGVTGNLEAWARRERYRFFSNVCEIAQLDFVLTAHNANDVSETLLMRLVSNKEPKSIHRIDLGRGLIRPLLSVPRQEIESYVAQNGLEYREDETNTDTRFLRNRVRKCLIPMIEREFDPRAAETLAERATAIAEDIEGLYELAGRVVSAAGKEDWGSPSWQRLLLSSIKDLPGAVSWRVLELLLLDHLGFHLGRAKSLEALQVLRAEIVGTELPGMFSLRRRSGWVVLSDRNGQILAGERRDSRTRFENDRIPNKA